MKSFAIACLAAASTDALNLFQSENYENDAEYEIDEYDEYDSADFLDDYAIVDSFYDEIEESLNAGNLVPLHALDNEILIVDLPTEESGESYSDESSYEEDYVVDAIAPIVHDIVLDPIVHEPITVQVIAEIVQGFENLAIDNAHAEEDAIVETQVVQEESVKILIEEANEKV